MKLVGICLGLLLATTGWAADGDVDQIKKLTLEFTGAIVSKDLSVIDRIFDNDAGNIYYDINEGPLTSLSRLKQVWRAATTNYTLAKFEFLPDMKILVKGDEALQTGSWTQTQQRRDGSSRDFSGRATILWKRTASGWKVYHYHASITPPRQPPAR